MGQDPGQDLVKAAAAGGVEGFLRAIAPGWVETGDWTADVIRMRRFKTQLKMLIRAREMCEQAGISPRAIPLKTFVPLLANSGLEDDPEFAEDPAGAEAMQERWASLLANAIDVNAPDVLPSFPAILAELTPADATMLDVLAKNDLPVDREQLVEALGVPEGEGHDDVRARERALIHVDNLRRLGLCDVEPPEGGQPAPFGTFYKMGERYWTNVKVSRFGRAFVAACTPPTPPAGAEA